MTISIADLRRIFVDTSAQNLSRFSDQDLSHVDAHGLAVLQSRNDVDAVFAFDHHLSLADLPVFPG